MFYFISHKYTIVCLKNKKKKLKSPKVPVIVRISFRLSRAKPKNPYKTLGDKLFVVNL